MNNKEKFIKFMETMKMSKEDLQEIVKSGLFGKEELESLVKTANKVLGKSEHFMWCVNWEISKFFTGEENPFEIQTVKENITLDSGIEMMWKLVGGITDADVQSFSNASARIFVGSSTTAENATQTGVITSLGSAGMDGTFPQVQGRSIIFQATFGDSDAVGAWREVSVYNAQGANSVALNRKVEDMGTKALGQSWTIKVTISAITG